MIRVGRVSGIDITIDPSWFVIFLIVAGSLAFGYLPERLGDATTAVHVGLGIALAVALFGSVLAHELAHALVARAREVRVDEIMLFIFGGVAKLRSEPEDARSELLIAAAGPALSIALGGALIGLGSALPDVVPDPIRVGLLWLGLINVALAVFNLVPGFPLDGGRILRAIVWSRNGDFERSTIIAARTGQVLAGLLVVLGVLFTLASGDPSWLWEVLIGWFLWSAAARSIRIARLKDAVEGVTVGELATERVPAIRADQDARVGLAQASAAGDLDELAVVEADGTLVGVVKVEALSEADPGRLARDLAEPPDEAQLLDPDLPAERMIERLAAAAGRLPLVVEDGRLVGTIDPRSLVSALDRGGSDAAP